MGHPSIAYPIDATGRILITDAADKEVATAKIMVGTVAVTLTTNTTGLKRRKLLIRNIKSPEVVVYIGDSTIEATPGLPLYQDDELTLHVSNDAIVKAIVDSGQGELRIMEVE